MIQHISYFPIAQSTYSLHHLFAHFPNSCNQTKRSPNTQANPLNQASFSVMMGLIQPFTSTEPTTKISEKWLESPVVWGYGVPSTNESSLNQHLGHYVPGGLGDAGKKVGGVRTFQSPPGQSRVSLVAEYSNKTPKTHPGPSCFLQSYICSMNCTLIMLRTISDSFASINRIISFFFLNQCHYAHLISLMTQFKINHYLEKLDTCCGKDIIQTLLCVIQQGRCGKLQPFNKISLKPDRYSTSLCLGLYIPKLMTIIYTDILVQENILFKRQHSSSYLVLESQGDSMHLLKIQHVCCCLSDC